MVMNPSHGKNALKPDLDATFFFSLPRRSAESVPYRRTQFVPPPRVEVRCIFSFPFSFFLSPPWQKPGKAPLRFRIHYNWCLFLYLPFFAFLDFLEGFFFFSLLLRNRHDEVRSCLWRYVDVDSIIPSINPTRLDASAARRIIEIFL